MTTTDLPSRLPHWHDEPDLYDTLILGGVQVPGVATVKISRKRKIDKKSAKGKNKGSVTTQGVEPAEVSIHVEVLSPSDFEALEDLMPMLEPVPDKEKATDEDALEIAHWAAKMRNVQAIVIESVEGPELKDGIMTLDVKAVEFDAKSLAKNAVSGLAGGTGTGAGAGGIYIGVFLDHTNQVIPESRVATQGSAAKDAKGELLKGPNGEDIFVWTILAIADGSSDGYYNASGTFIGRYFGPDELLTNAWNAVHVTYPKDVTNTPKKAQAPDTSGFVGPPPNDAPDPATTDAGPDA